MTHIFGKPAGRWGRRGGDLIIVAVLITIAFLPRSHGLSTFLTADEDTMLGRSYRLLEAVSKSNWEDVPHEDPVPAMTTYGLGALGILSYYAPEMSWSEDGLLVQGKALSDVYQPSLEIFARGRYLSVSLIAFSIGAMYLILRQVLDRPTSYLVAALIAFDPFFIAQSRVLGYHSLHAIFAVMSISCLCVCLHKRQRRWFVLCGIFVGLAWLSLFAASTLAIVVFVVLMADQLLRPRSGKTRDWKRLLADLMVLYGAAALTIFVLWPSMWIQPLQTIQSVIQETGFVNPSGTFFWGENWINPGVFFYPVVFLFRGTPIVLVGAGVALVALGTRLKGSPLKAWDNRYPCLATFWVLFLGYFIVLSATISKADRYILPGFLTLDVLAALGWSFALRKAFLKWPKLQSDRSLTYGVVIICCLQAATCLPYHPYYFSYFNPIVGGAKTAVGVVPVGWGEGLEQAADYLNSKENSEDLKVGVVYPHLFRHFFKGDIHKRKFPPTSEGRHRQWSVELDYAVVYINALQRFKLPRSFVELYRAEDAEFRVWQNGIEYAQVYKISDDKFRAIPDSATPWEAQYDIGLNLVGYKTYPVEFDRLTGNHLLAAVLFWQFEGSCSKDYYFTYQLADDAGTVWASKQLLPYCADWERADNDSLIFPEDLLLEVDPALPKGLYQLEISQRKIPEGEELPVRSGRPILPVTIGRAQ